MDHKCQECDETIEAGERVWAGEAINGSTVFTCQFCMDDTIENNEYIASDLARIFPTGRWARIK